MKEPIYKQSRMSPRLPRKLSSCLSPSCTLGSHLRLSHRPSHRLSYTSSFGLSPKLSPAAPKAVP